MIINHDDKLESITGMLDDKILQMSIKELVEHRDVVEFTKSENKFLIKIRKDNEISNLVICIGEVNNKE